MKQKQRLNRAQAEGEELVAEYVESELTQREFCVQKGICVGTLAYWLRKVSSAETAAGQSGARLMEVQLISDDQSRVTRDQERPGYELLLPGERRLRVPRGFDAEEVAVLLGVLEGGAC